jgi:hypothetical protein
MIFFAGGSPRANAGGIGFTTSPKSRFDALSHQFKSPPAVAWDFGLMWFALDVLSSFHLSFSATFYQPAAAKLICSPQI